MTTVTQAHAQQRNGQTEYASAALAIRDGQDFWDAKQIAALQVLGIKDATNADLAVFMHYCQKTGLDPFSKQIYMLPRREKQGDQWVTKQTIQVGIDGFRVIRDRAERRDHVTVEYEDTRWFDANGVPHEVWLSTEPPAACAMAVIKGGKRYPAVLTFAEYVQVNKDGRPTGKWAGAPAHQIEKCTEAFALRRAFPHDLAGLHTDDETAHLDNPPSSRRRRPAQRIASPPVMDAEIVEAPAAGDSAPSASPPPQDRRRPLGKTALGRLRAALGRLPLDSGDDYLVAVSYLAGRPVNLLEDLTQDEAVTVTKALDGYLARTDGDSSAAVEALWVDYHQNAEATQDGPEDGDG